MRYFQTALESVLPLFIYMAAGVGLRKLRIFSATINNCINAVVYRCLLPVCVFKSVVGAEHGGQLKLLLILVALICIVMEFASSVYMLKNTDLSNMDKATAAQSMARSNFVVFGAAITVAVYGENAMTSAMMLVAIVVPANAILTAGVFAAYCNTKTGWCPIIWKLISNPNLLATVLGLLVLRYQIRLPCVIQKSIQVISRISTPLSLIALGSSLQFGLPKEQIAMSMHVCAYRLLVAPFFGVLLGISAGLRREELLVLYALCGAPSAVACYSTAQQLGGRAELAGLHIMVTSVMSPFAIVLWITVLGSLNVL